MTRLFEVWTHLCIKEILIVGHQLFLGPCLRYILHCPFQLVLYLELCTSKPSSFTNSNITTLMFLYHFYNNLVLACIFINVCECYLFL